MNALGVKLPGPAAPDASRVATMRADRTRVAILFPADAERRKATTAEASRFAGLSAFG